MYGLIPIRFLAESVEAGASIWQITGQETDIVLGVGNLRHAFRKDCVNVVCLDDDARIGRMEAGTGRFGQRVPPATWC